MAPLALLGTLGPTELIIILAILVLLFGARKIPELAKGLGQGVRGFQSALKDDESKEGQDSSKS